jgi:hypothetical protein
MPRLVVAYREQPDWPAFAERRRKLIGAEIGNQLRSAHGALDRESHHFLSHYFSLPCEPRSDWFPIDPDRPRRMNLGALLKADDVLS